MADIGGTFRKFTINSVEFRAVHDIDVNEINTEFENTVIPTSGDPIISQEKKVATREDVVLACGDQEYELLCNWADSGALLTYSYTNRMGNTWRSSGFINIAGRNSKELRTSLTLLPTKKFTLSLA
jgi:hypothetical protein